MLGVKGTGQQPRCLSIDKACRAGSCEAGNAFQENTD
jgi:hypothetical protein